MDVRFNINDYVRVRLTDSGKLIHRRRHDEFRRQYPQVTERYKPPVKDADGYTRWQMWDLMKTFGPHISLGSDPPFEMEIVFEGATQPA